MVSGGPRRNSGPAPSPNSNTSDRRGLKFSSLPAEGYDGPIPEFPRPILFGTELAHWQWAWRTPQAALWATPQWSWLIPAVAHYCSLMAQSETENCPVGVHAQIRGRENEILLARDALLKAGYQIAIDELSERREEASTEASGSRARLKVAGDGR